MANVVPSLGEYFLSLLFYCLSILVDHYLVSDLVRMLHFSSSLFFAICKIIILRILFIDVLSIYHWIKTSLTLLVALTVSITSVVLITIPKNVLLLKILIKLAVNVSELFILKEGILRYIILSYDLFIVV